MQEISVSEFRQKCLALIDGLPADGILITRHGRPVAKILPVVPSCAELIGSMPGIIADSNEDLLSTGIRWDAESLVPEEDAC